MTAPLTPAERKRRERARKAAEGWRKVEVWVLPSRVPELLATERRLRKPKRTAR